MSSPETATQPKRELGRSMSAASASVQPPVRRVRSAQSGAEARQRQREYYWEHRDRIRAQRQEKRERKNGFGSEQASSASQDGLRVDPVNLVKAVGDPWIALFGGVFERALCDLRTGKGEKGRPLDQGERQAIDGFFRCEFVGSACEELGWGHERIEHLVQETVSCRAVPASCPTAEEPGLSALTALVGKSETEPFGAL